MGERLLHLGDGHLAAVGDLRELGTEVPILVEVADDLVADAADDVVLGREAQLLVEVVGERRHRAHDVLERQVVAVLLLDERALLVVVEHDGREVERQVVVLPLVTRGLGRGRRLGGLGHPRVRLHRRLATIRRLLAVRGFRQLLEERILEQLLLDNLLQLEGRELEELDRLLQQRSHDDPLTLAEREARFHGHGGSRFAS